MGIELVAEKLGVSTRTVERLAAAGKLDAVHLGHRRVFRSADVERLSRAS